MPQLVYSEARASGDSERARFPVLLLVALSLTAAGPGSGSSRALEAAEALIGEGRVEEARRELLRVAEENKGSTLELEARIREIDLEEDGQRHLARLEELVGRTNSPLVPFAIGKYRYAVGAYAAAAGDFRAARRGLSGEERAEANVWEGIALFAAGEEKKGLELLEKRARSTPAGRAADRARYLAAQIHWQRGAYRKCKALALPLTERDNDFLLPATLIAARSHRELGEGGEARALFARLAERFAGSGEAAAAREALVSLQEERGPAEGYYVQIASFEKEENARRFLAAKRGGGVGAVEMFPTERDGMTYYPIRVGPFASEDEARGAKERLAEQGLDGNVVRVEK